MTSGVVDELFALYHQWGHDPYDEVVSQLDHALQTAALAEDAGAPDALIAAALLHDVGHLLALAGSGSFSEVSGDLHHEAAGARYLAAWFPSSVTAPVANHVRAKRYRCAVTPDYTSRLSEGSKASLLRQGGPMQPAEVQSFAATLGFDDAVRLREWDDAGKVVGLHVKPLAAYRGLLQRLI